MLPDTQTQTCQAKNQILYETPEIEIHCAKRSGQLQGKKEAADSFTFFHWHW